MVQVAAQVVLENVPGGHAAHAKAPKEPTPQHPGAGEGVDDALGRLFPAPSVREAVGEALAVKLPLMVVVGVMEALSVPLIEPLPVDVGVRVAVGEAEIQTLRDADGEVLVVVVVLAVIAGVSEALSVPLRVDVSVGGGEIVPVTEGVREAVPVTVTEGVGVAVPEAEGVPLAVGGGVPVAVAVEVAFEMHSVAPS